MEHDTLSGKKEMRGLGPFTGGQLTVIIVAAMLAMGVPAGAFAAASGSNVFVTDHISGSHASVTSSGRLSTAAVPAVGSRIETGVASASSGACAFVYPPPGSAFVVTEVQWAPRGAAVGAETGEYLNLDAKPDCSDVLHTIAGGSFVQDGSYETTYSPGITIQHGHYLDLQVTGGGGAYSEAFVYGYYVPSSECAGVPCY